MTSKHQITIPADAFDEARLAEGDVLAVRADGAGRLIIERERDLIDEFAGSLSGVFEPGYLDALRDEWD